MSPTLVVIFAKAPQAGRVKTRLAASIGALEAERLYKRLLERTIATALSARCGPVELHGMPRDHALLRAIALRNRIALRSQSAGDLGTKMGSAFRQGLRSHRKMVLIGCDCPALDVRDLRRAARLLSGCDAVLSPAEDGGYPLIGLSRCTPRLFDDMKWSTPTVIGDTRHRLRELGWTWRELRTLWDVDRLEDLERLRSANLLARRP